MQMKVKKVSELELAFQPATREWVVKQIQKRQETDQEINSGAIQRENKTLHERARDLFGSWDEALLAAGTDPADVRLRKKYESWTSKKVLERIKRRRSSGKSLKHKVVKEDKRGLVVAADRYFSSWYSAVLEAGFNPRKIKNK
jgi:hypothetical protein